MAKKKVATTKKVPKKPKQTQEQIDQEKYSELMQEMAETKRRMAEMEAEKTLEEKPTQVEEPEPLGGIDWGTVVKLHEELAISGSTFRQKDIPANSSQEFRLMQPTQEDMNRIPFAQSTTFWINNTPYLSLETFGEDCPMANELKIAKKSKDSEVKALISNSKIFNTQKDFFLVTLLIESIYDNGGLLTNIRVVGNQARIFEVSAATMNKILTISRDKHYVAAGKGLSIFHRDLGYSITISKTVVKNKTSYNVIVHPIQQSFGDAQYDKYYNETCDIMGYFETKRKSPDYLRAIIRNFLYSEPLPVDNNGTTQGNQLQTSNTPQGSILANVANLGDN